MKRGARLGAAGLAALVIGCAVRLGGPGPVEYPTLALDAGQGVAAFVVADEIRRVGARLVLLAGAADSAWFAEVAQRTEKELSGPGDAGTTSLAFLAGKPVGDTTLALSMEGGGRFVVHDALYTVDKSRFLDLLATRADSGVDLRSFVRALLQYVATDVMPHAAVVLAVDVADPAAGDSLAALLDPALTDAQACGREEGRTAPAAVQRQVEMRLFYGPPAIMTCRSVRVLNGARAPVLAQLVVGR